MANDFNNNLFVERITSLKNGDRTQESILYAEAHPRLLKFCILLCHNREIAEDLSQEALLKSFNSISALTKPEQYLSWLFQIAKNIFLDQQRRVVSFKKISRDFIQEAYTAGHSENHIEIKELLLQLSIEDRFLFLLIELEERSYKEVAEILGTSEDAIRSKLHRLRGAFHQQSSPRKAA